MQRIVKIPAPGGSLAALAALKHLGACPGPWGLSEPPGALGPLEVALGALGPHGHSRQKSANSRQNGLPPQHVVNCDPHRFQAPKTLAKLK